jgi:hypothetical protein
MKGGWGNGARGLVHIVWEQSHALKRGFPAKCCFSILRPTGPDQQFLRRLTYRPPFYPKHWQYSPLLCLAQ